MISRVFFITFCIASSLSAYQMQLMTIITGPIGTQSQSVYLGHFGVTRSLIAGLKKNNISFNYNPRSIDMVGDVLYIVAGNADVIGQGVELKRQGKVRVLLVGPNTADLFRSAHNYGNNRLIDLRVNPSLWIENAHLLRCPDLKKSDFLIWPAGIDEQFFMPISNNKGKKVLIYNKFQDSLTKDVLQLLMHYGFDPVIIRYGHYTPEQYKKILSTISFAVFLTKTESQSLALAECWAMDVPTLCWNCKEPHEYLGIYYPFSSACPYLTDATGFEWKTLKDLEMLLKKIGHIFDHCYPRQWVLENMTDTIVVQKLIEAIHNLSL